MINIYPKIWISQLGVHLDAVVFFSECPIYEWHWMTIQDHHAAELSNLEMEHQHGLLFIPRIFVIWLDERIF